MDSFKELAAGRRAVSFPQKKKKQKENTKEHLSIVHMYNSTIGKGSTEDSKVNSTNDTKGKRSQDPARPKRLQLDIEIDHYLLSLLNEGFIADQWRAWHAGAIYKLGFERYHATVLDVRRAKEDCDSQGKKCDIMRLLAYKIKGRLELHAKEQLQREGYIE
jgi:hypothetical protein